MRTHAHVVCALCVNNHPIPSCWPPATHASPAAKTRHAPAPRAILSLTPPFSPRPDTRSAGSGVQPTTEQPAGNEQPAPAQPSDGPAAPAQPAEGLPGGDQEEGPLSTTT